MSNKDRRDEGGIEIKVVITTPTILSAPPILLDALFYMYM